MKSFIAAVCVCMLLTVSGTVADDSQQLLVPQLKAGGFSGFAHLIELSGLTGAMNKAAATGSITIVAPTDDALMNRVSPAVLSYLKAPANRNLLRQVILHHVITDHISAFQWDGQHATLEGSPVELRLDALAFYVSSVPVSMYNALILPSQAPVHGLSGLLVPAGLESTFTGSDLLGSDDNTAAPRRTLLIESTEAPGSAPAPSPSPVPAPAPAPENAPAPGPSPLSQLPPPPPKSASKFVASASLILAAAMAVAALC